jgi:hypothetical protein
VILGTLTKYCDSSSDGIGGLMSAAQNDDVALRSMALCVADMVA